MLGEGKVAVDLVGDDSHVIPGAKSADLPQLLRRPDPAHRVVRAAQQEKLDLLLRDLPLQIVKVDGVAAVLIDHLALHHLAVVVSNDGVEGVVDRTLDQNGVSRPGSRPNGRSQGKDHAGGLDQPLGPGFPAEAAGEPADDRLVIVGFGIGVAEDAVGDAFLQRLQHAGGSLEIHIRHPEGEHIRWTAPLYGKIIFQTVGIFPVNKGIKIKCGHGYPSAAVFRSAIKSSSCSRPTESRSSVSVMPRCSRTWAGTSGWVWTRG